MVMMETQQMAMKMFLVVSAMTIKRVMIYFFIF